jgi:hypothetical protein
VVVVVVVVVVVAVAVAEAFCVLGKCHRHGVICGDFPSLAYEY